MPSSRIARELQNIDLVKVGPSEFSKFLTTTDLFHFRPQYKWLTLPMRSRSIQVDFLARQESLQKDYEFIADRIGIVDRPLLSRNVGVGREDLHSGNLKVFSISDLDSTAMKRLRDYYDLDYRLLDY